MPRDKPLVSQCWWATAVMASCPLLSQTLGGREAPSIPHTHKHLAVKSQGSPAVTSLYIRRGGGGKGAWASQQRGLGWICLYHRGRGMMTGYWQKSWWTQCGGRTNHRESSYWDTLCSQGGEVLRGNIWGAGVRKKTVGGREEDSLIRIAERAAPVNSTGYKHYSHTGGAAGANHGGAAKLQQQQQQHDKQLQGLPPCCGLLLLFLLHSFTLFAGRTLPPILTPPVFASLASWMFSHSSLFGILTFIPHLFFFSIHTLLSFIMDSLKISTSCSGPCSPGASQAVLIPTPEESSRQKHFCFLHLPLSSLGSQPTFSCPLLPAGPTEHASKSNFFWCRSDTERGGDQGVSRKCVRAFVKHFTRVALIQMAAACITQQ